MSVSGSVLVGVTLFEVWHNSLRSSRSLACFARGPCFIGEANRLYLFFIYHYYANIMQGDGCAQGELQ